MALKRTQKVELVDQVTQTATDALTVVLADYHGVDVQSLSELRSEARKNGVHLQVLSNRLAKIAFAKTDFACLEPFLKGPTLFAFSLNDPGAAARLLKDFAKEQDAFSVKALALPNQLFDASQIDKLAKLPTIEQAYAQLACVLQAPLTKLATTLNAVPGKFARTLAALQDEKQAA